MDGGSQARTAASGIGAVSARDRYLGKRMLYRTTRGARRGAIAGDAAFDAVSGREAGEAIVKIVLLTIGLWIPASLLIVLAIAVLGGNRYGVGPLDVVRAPFMLLTLFGSELGIVALLSLVVLVVAFLVAGLIPERRYAADWGLTVEAGTASAGTVVKAIERTIHGRKLPVLVQHEDVDQGLSGKAPYLRLRQGPFTGVIGALDMGSTIFIRWSLWCERSRFRVVGAYLGHLASVVVGRGSAFHQVLRTDDARAMRDAIHDAVRAGIDQAMPGRG